jgi:hypothetical protein
MDKAQAAINLLMDDFFKGEIETMRQGYIQRIVNSRPMDIDEREDAYKALNTLDAFVSHFESIASQKMIDSKRWKIF